MIRRSLVVAAAGLCLAACSSSAPAAPGTAVSITSAVTFHEDVEPILQASCQPCHVAGGVAPFPLVTYSDAKPYAGLMAAQTGAGTMPPWGAVQTPDCTPRFDWKDDVRLTTAAIATIAAWNEQGAVEGNPSDAPPPAAPTTIGLTKVDLSIEPPAPYAIAVGGADQFRCFVMDPQLAATQYIDGTYLIPGNSTIVHHALVFADPSGASKALVTDPTTNSYDCFGGPGFSNTTLLAAWAPGGVPVEYPPNVGAELDPGTLLVMQVHYHPHSATATFAPDQSVFQMQFTDSVPAHMATTLLLGNFDSPVATSGSLEGTGLLPGPDDPPSGPVFDIPPNVSAHTETMQVTVPAGEAPVQVVGIGGHEHYVGSAVNITIARNNPAEASSPASECLLSIPQWNFNWQRFYAYDTTLDQLPSAMAGDVVTIRCTYDNTLDNLLLVASLASQGLEQPQDVKLGETTLDEMCLGAFLVMK